MRILIIILCSLFLTSCLPGRNLLSKDEKKEFRQKKRCNRKLERLTKKCPILTDTVVEIIEVPVQVDSLAIFKAFPQDTSTSGLDTIFERHKVLIDSLVGNNDSLRNSLYNALRSDVRRYIVTRPCLPEEIGIDTTITLIIDGKEFKIPIKAKAQSDDKGQIVLSIQVPQTNFTAEITDEDTKIQKKDWTVKEWIYWLRGQAIWILIILIILGFIVFAIKVGFKSINPFK